MFNKSNIRLEYKEQMKGSHDYKGDPFKIIPKLISIETIIDQRIMSIFRTIEEN